MRHSLNPSGTRIVGIETYRVCAGWNNWQFLIRPKIKLERQSLVLAMLVVAAVAPVHAALVNVQILGHGGNQKGQPDPQPPAYQGAGVVGADRDYCNGVRADSFGQWDELRRRTPGLRIDSCASGGRRNDLESMRRAVPNSRSDFQFPTMKGVVEGNQNHTYGLSFWLPWQGSGCYFTDTYSIRSFYLPGFGMTAMSELEPSRGTLKAENAEVLKKAYRECDRIAPYMLCDYYPLTPYTLELDQWIAWQFNRPEQSEGVVQAFRRGKNQEPARTFRLYGLDPATRYKITNLDGEGSTISSGKDLMENGLRLDVKERPAAAVVLYTKADD
jgi:alpha-galactosidase